MKKLLQSKWAIFLLAGLLIAFGGYYALRSFDRVRDSYRAMQFAMEHDFDGGHPDIELISPWMNIQYIAEAYTVPQSFILDEVGLDSRRPNAQLPLGRINNHQELGENEAGEPVLVDLVTEAILKYREDPVATGLTEGQVQAWMNVTYIANSTGIPVETLFEAVGLPADGFAFMPLDRLVAQANYEPGVEALIKTLNEAVDANGGTR